MSDWGQGYCYQMWRGRNNTVRLDGMGGQFVVLIPDKDAMVVLTANAKNTQDELNLIHNYLIPAIKSEKPLPENSDLVSTLQKKEAMLNLKPFNMPLHQNQNWNQEFQKKSSLLKKIPTISSRYILPLAEVNAALPSKGMIIISIVKCSADGWKLSKSASQSLLASSRVVSKSIDANYKVQQPVIRVATSYSWTDKYTLELTARFIEESLGSETIVCKFSEFSGNVNVSIEQKPGGLMMRMPGSPATPLRGTLIKIK